MARDRMAGVEPAPTTSTPGTASAETGGEGAIAGRQSALATLGATVATVRRGAGRTVLIAGEAGIGKSRVIRETMAMARSQGFIASSADCLIEPGAPPFDVWIRALRGVGRGEAAFLLEGLGSQNASTPYSSWRGRNLSADEAQFRLMSEILGVLERETASRPLLLCVDDLQWADASSLRLFQFLAQRAGHLALGIVGAVRTEEQQQPEITTVVDSLTGRAAFTLLELSPLSFRESRLLIERSIAVDDARAMALYAHSEGNPFVLEETIRLLNTTGIDERATLPLPRSVAAAIQSRLGQLTAQDRAMLEICAVAGKRFRISVVAAAQGITESDAIAACERLCQRAMLRRIDTGDERAYQFLHDRFRATVLDTIGREHLRVNHLRLAQSLEASSRTASDPDSIAQLATHYRAAGKTDQASRYYVELGRLALVRLSPDEAAAAFQTALDFFPAEGPALDRAQIHMAHGNALLASGKRSAIDAFAQAEEAFTGVRSWREAAIACDYLARALAADEQHEAARDVWERGLRWLDSLAYDDVDLDRATMLIHQSEVLGPSLGRFDDAMRVQRKALNLLPAGATGDRGRAEASLALGRTLIRMNRLPEAASVLQDALPAAVTSNDLSLAAETEAAIATVCYWQGRMRESRTSTQRREAFAAASGDRRSKRHTNAWLALIESTLGNLDTADRLLDAAERDVSEFDSPEPLAFTRQIRGHLAFLRGDASQAFSLMRESLDTFLPIGPTTSLWYLGYVARVAFHAREFEEHDRLRQLSWSMLDAVPRSALPRAGTLTHLSLLAVESGDDANSAMLLDELDPFGGQLQWHLVDRVRAGLARQLGQVDLSARMLASAIAQAREQDLRVDLDLAQRQMAELSAQTSASSPALRPKLAVELLSGREIEVLQRVASGQTNREIAAVLGISEKTVRNHLTHILDKLDLDNRTAAAAWAIRHGLG